MKLGKKSKYNLSDGEDEDEFEESGLGSFPEKDDFEDDVPFEDDEDKELGESGSIFFSYYIEVLTYIVECI